jgi:hypothetical protein
VTGANLQILSEEIVDRGVAAHLVFVLDDVMSLVLEDKILHVLTLCTKGFDNVS